MEGKMTTLTEQGLIGQGSVEKPLLPEDISSLLAQAFNPLPLDGKRVLVIIPDGTRMALIPTMFRLLYEQIGRRVARLDFLIALGTHPLMPEAAITRLVGVSEAERAEKYPNVRIFNHRWDQPTALQTVGVITRGEMATLTDGLMAVATPATLNKQIFEYDQLIICGPVFPHEVVGFSGGAKYLFPGIAGPDIINVTHWLGALVTSMKTVGVKDTPARRVIHRAAELVNRPLLCLAMALSGHDLHGLFIGTCAEAWSAAADLSARLNIITVPHPFRQVLSIPAVMYDDLWTAAKAMYKTEPVIADDGEVIIYAPHITEISYTHGTLIRQVGYHVRDYFVKQWDKYSQIPWAILAHSTHVRGAGTYENGVERPRIRVTLATGIPRAVCEAVNLGYRDPREIDPTTWAVKGDPDRLIVPRAGEYLYRLKD
jgi:nickel-dependent lactate racemase